MQGFAMTDFVDHLCRFCGELFNSERTPNYCPHCGKDFDPSIDTIVFRVNGAKTEARAYLPNGEQAVLSIDHHGRWQARIARELFKSIDGEPMEAVSRHVLPAQSVYEAGTFLLKNILHLHNHSHKFVLDLGRQ